PRQRDRCLAWGRRASQLTPTHRRDGARPLVQGTGAVVHGEGLSAPAYSASRSWATRAGICAGAAAPSLVTITSAPCFAPSVMIISGDPASIGTPPGVARVTGAPALPTASAMSAAGRACSPTREPTVTL